MLRNTFKALAGFAIVSSAAAQSSAPLPTVNLGYEVHQAAFFNVGQSCLITQNHLLTYLQSTGGFYNFSNIRYAEPPVGNLRFRAPVPVTTKSNTIQNGSVGAICPQAAPAWLAITPNFTTAYLTGQSFNYEAAVAALSKASGPAPAMDPRTSEDCLFLDVIVPKQIFDQAGNNSCRGAPVMVWIYGGGYTLGSKAGSGNPAGLIKASQVSGTAGIIYVSLNYRVRSRLGFHAA